MAKWREASVTETAGNEGISHDSGFCFQLHSNFFCHGFFFHFKVKQLVPFAFPIKACLYFLNPVKTFAGYELEKQFWIHPCSQPEGELVT